MRATKAKQLRHIAKEHFGGPVVQYAEQAHKPKLVPTGRLTEKGLPEQVAVTPVTRHLSEGCQRAAYQKLKGRG